MPFVEVKNDNGSTTYRWVKDIDIYNEQNYQNEQQGDLTTGTASLVALDISKEKYNQIFKRGGNDVRERGKC